MLDISDQNAQRGCFLDYTKPRSPYCEPNPMADLHAKRKQCINLNGSYYASQINVTFDTSWFMTKKTHIFLPLCFSPV